MSGFPEALRRVEEAIRHAVAAGKLRLYVRQHGGRGLDGLLKLADRHSRLAASALKSESSAVSKRPGNDGDI